MAVKVEVLLNAEQLRDAFDKLPKAEKLRLFDDITRATWGDRFDRVVWRIRRRARRYPPISEAEIVRICREVRRDRYAILHHRRGR